MSAKEYCQKEPSTFGCRGIELSDDSGSDTTASNVTYEAYNGTHDVTVRFDQIKVNLSDAGFEIDGKLNPVIRVICNNTEDCDLQIEVVQQQPNKTCVVSFEDVSSDMTSDDMDFGFKEDDDGPIAVMQAAARDASKIELDKKIHGRLQQLSFMGEVPESGPKREKADRFADFLSKAREGRDAFMRGEQVMQKMIQTRKMKSNLKSTLTRMVSSCFDDTILEDNVTDAELEETFVSYNTSKRRGDGKFKPGGLGGVDFEVGLPKKPTKPEGGWGDFKDIGFRKPQIPGLGGDGDAPSSPSGGGFAAPPAAPAGGGLPEGGGGGSGEGLPSFPLNRRRLSEAAESANGDGGVVPVDSPSPPALPPTASTLPSPSPPVLSSSPVSPPSPSPPSHPPPTHPPPTHPPPAHPTPPGCISTTSTISAMSGTYYIDGSTDAKTYGSGKFHLHITAGDQHPLRFKHEGGMSSCCPTMTAKPADSTVGAGMMINLTGPLDSGVSYTYYYGNWEATFGADSNCHAHPMSLVCGYHGYMNAQNRLSWDANCSQTASPSPPSSPPPSASPSPPPSPASPGTPPPPNHPPPEAAEYVVKFTATIAGTVDAFDQEAYKAKLANATGANASHIELTVTPASINVEARITTTSYSQATSVEDVLAPLENDTSGASSLLGVTVESVQPVSVDAVASPPPPGSPPPSPSSPPSSDDNNMVTVSVIVAVAGVAVVATAAVTMVWFRRRAASTGTPKATEAKVEAVIQSAPLLSMKT